MESNISSHFLNGFGLIADANGGHCGWKFSIEIEVECKLYLQLSRQMIASSGGSLYCMFPGDGTYCRIIGDGQ